MAKHYIGACKDVEVRNNSSSGGYLQYYQIMYLIMMV